MREEIAGHDWKRPPAWYWVALVLLLIVVSNVVLVLVTTGKGKERVFTPLPSQFGEGILTATSLGGTRMVLATMDSQVVLVEDGKELARTQPRATVADIAYWPTGKEILVGGNDGVIYAYDPELKEIGSVDLNKGLILKLGIMDDGRVTAATGTGAYGDLFFVAVLNSDRTVRFTYQVGRPIESVGAVHGLALAGDDSAWVTAVGADGTRAWESQLVRSVTALRGLGRQSRVLAGDVEGNAYLLDGKSGAVLWQASISQWKIEAIQPCNEQIIAFGDTRGGLYLLDQQGRVLLSYGGTGCRVVALLAAGTRQTTAVCRNGDLVQIDVERLTSAQWVDRLRPLWVIMDALWAATLLGLLMRAVARLKEGLAKARREVERSLPGYAFLLPAFLCILIFVYLPALMAGYYSLTDFKPGEPIQFIGLGNFVRLFTQDKLFWRGFGNMFLLMATGTIKALTMPWLAALLVFHLKNPRVQYLTRTAFIVPSIVPGIVTVLLWRMIYAPGEIGLVNSLLRLLGHPEWQSAWLGEEKTAIWAIIFSGFPWVGAFGFLIYLGGLINIGTELMDAATIDGVSAWQRLWFVEWPLVGPQRSLLLFFTYLGSIQGFADIYVFTEGGPGHSTYVPALQMYFRLTRGLEVGYASSIGFVLLLIVLVVTIVRRIFEHGESQV